MMKRALALAFYLGICAPAMAVPGGTSAPPTPSLIGAATTSALSAETTRAQAAEAAAQATANANATVLASPAVASKAALTNRAPSTTDNSININGGNNWTWQDNFGNWRTLEPTNLQNGNGEWPDWSPIARPADVVGYQLSSITQTAGGSGYTAGEILYLKGGVKLTINTVSGGAITSFTTNSNMMYACLPSSLTGMTQTAVYTSGGATGTGSGATFTIVPAIPYVVGTKLMTRCFTTTPQSGDQTYTSTGYNFTVARSDDGETLGIPFLPSGDADWSKLFGFTQGGANQNTYYNYNSGPYPLITDWAEQDGQSTNGSCDAYGVAGPTPTAPTTFPSILVGGVPTVMFNAVGNGGLGTVSNHPANTFMTIPPSCEKVPLQNFTLVVVGQAVEDDYNDPTFVGFGSSASGSQIGGISVDGREVGLQFSNNSPTGGQTGSSGASITGSTLTVTNDTSGTFHPPDVIIGHGIPPNVQIIAAAVDGVATSVTVSGSVMTVAGWSSGTFNVGDYVSLAGVPNGYRISSDGTGVGQNGTYNMNASETVGTAEAATAYVSGNGTYTLNTTFGTGSLPNVSAESISAIGGNPGLGTAPDNPCIYIGNSNGTSVTFSACNTYMSYNDLYHKGGINTNTNGGYLGQAMEGNSTNNGHVRLSAVMEIPWSLPAANMAQLSASLAYWYRIPQQYSTYLGYIVDSYGDDWGQWNQMDLSMVVQQDLNRPDIESVVMGHTGATVGTDPNQGNYGLGDYSFFSQYIAPGFEAATEPLQIAVTEIGQNDIGVNLSYGNTDAQAIAAVEASFVNLTTELHQLGILDGHPIIVDCADPPLRTPTPANVGNQMADVQTYITWLHNHALSGCDYTIPVDSLISEYNQVTGPWVAPDYLGPAFIHQTPDGNAKLGAVYAAYIAKQLPPAP